jgi:cellulose synthase/poly-beta-1,6-N-acetylglucosamine synthase-like glycosyltransferase
MLHAILVAAVWMGALLLFVLLPLNLAATPRLSKPRSVSTGRPPVSIVIPARDEEESVEEAVRSHLAQAYPDFEVLVVEDRSRDRTREILERLAREDPRLSVLPGSDPPAGWIGKPHALHLGAAAARGELLLFADADVIYDPRTLSEAVSYLEARRASLVCLLPRMEARGFWENVLMPYVEGAYFGGFGFLANCDRPRWLAGGGGAGNLIRREVYAALGGHAALKNSVVDDVHLALNAKRAGFRTRVLRAEDRVRVRMYRGLSGVVRGFTKNTAYAINGLVGAALLSATAFVTILWVVPPLVLLGALAGIPFERADVLLAAAGFALPVAARLVASGALGDAAWPAVTHPIMAATWGFIICRSLYQRFVRRRLVWRGREFDAREAGF